jgi:hypothetical protein
MLSVGINCVREVFVISPSVCINSWCVTSENSFLGRKLVFYYFTRPAFGNAEQVTLVTALNEWDDVIYESVRLDAHSPFSYLADTFTLRRTKSRTRGKNQGSFKFGAGLYLRRSGSIPGRDFLVYILAGLPKGLPILLVSSHGKPVCDCKLHGVKLTTQSQLVLCLTL